MVSVMFIIDDLIIGGALMGLAGMLSADSRTEGIKEGYAHASREYEAKFQSLKEQLTKAHHTIQKQAEYISELRDFNKSLLSVIERYRSEGQDVNSLLDTYIHAQELERRFAA